MAAGEGDAIVERIEQAQGRTRARSASSSAEIGVQPVYDRGAALGRLLGNETLLIEMARMFHEDAPKLLDGLREALTAADAARVRREAHSLAGKSATFDGHEAIEAAHAVESAAARGDLDYVRGVVDRLIDEVTRLDQALVRDLGLVSGENALRGRTRRGRKASG